MDELKVESSFMRRCVSTIIGRWLAKKIGNAFDIFLYHLSVTQDENAMYNIRIDCDVQITKEDLQKLIWKDQNGSGTS